MEKFTIVFDLSEFNLSAQELTRGLFTNDISGFVDFAYDLPDNPVKGGNQVTLVGSGSLDGYLDAFEIVAHNFNARESIDSKTPGARVDVIRKYPMHGQPIIGLKSLSS